MCGVTGFLAPTPLTEDDRQIILSMVRCLDHRGPDDRGVFIDAEQGLALGHSRLSILDLSAAGHQPMASSDGRFVISYNGEIYNFQELRRQLESQGHSPEAGWRGGSDTEVLLQAISAWGLEPALERCVGMFALALWDRHDRRLTLVRDRLGIKPLYYGLQRKHLLFGSELKPLRVHPAFQEELDPAALALYLRHLYVPTPLCIYSGLRKLPPGCLLSITRDDLNKGQLPEPSAYYRLQGALAAGYDRPFTTEEEALDALTRGLRDAVKLRMIADVPLGALLSGGVDSSMVTALMQDQSTRPVKTFSIGTEHQEYNEAPMAKAVARHLGTDHTEFYVTAQDALDVVPLLPRIYDEPFADASQIPTFLVCKLARSQVTVCLSGDGGDELFAGYNRHVLAPMLWRRLGRLPRGLRTILAGLLTHGGGKALATAYKSLSPLLSREQRHILFQDKTEKAALALAADDFSGFYRRLASIWLEDEPNPAGVPVILPIHLTHPPISPDSLDPASWLMLMDQLTYLPDDILTKVDRASMAVSLESRVPILDHRVVEIAWRTPVSMKIRNGRGKHLLRQSLYQYVPQELVDRPKQGFGIPLEAWLRGPLKAWAEDLLSEDRLRREEFLDPAPVRRAWTEHQQGRNRQYKIWAVLMFQAWLEEQRNAPSGQKRSAS